MTTLPGSGTAGSTAEFVFNFNKAVDVSGGTPTLLLSNGDSAVYDPAATAALHDATKLVFDCFDTYNGPPRYAGGGPRLRHRLCRERRHACRSGWPCYRHPARHPSVAVKS